MKKQNHSSGRYAPVRAVGKHLSQSLRKIDRLIWPDVSVVTGNPIAGPGLIEPELWTQIVFLTDPQCNICGLPFEIEVEEGQICAACQARPPAFDHARSALVYGDVSKQIVLRMKRRGDRYGLNLLAQWMALAGKDILEQSDLIVPTPLHYMRLVQRGFNQSAWLGAGIAQHVGRPYRAHVIKRVRNTPSQAGKSISGRKRNVQGAFKVPSWWKSATENKTVLLVDDVFTTGATSHACALALKRAGANKVNVLTLSRVVNVKDPTI